MPLVKKLRSAIGWVIGGGARRRIVVVLALALLGGASFFALRKVRRAVRAAHADSLRVHIADFTHADPGRQSAASRKLAESGVGALTVLKEALNAKEPVARWWAATTLAELESRNVEAATALARRLEAEMDPRVKCALIDALGRLGSETELLILLQMMSQSDETVRAAAAAALVDLPTTNPERMAAVVDLLADQDPFVRATSRRLVSAMRRSEVETAIANGDSPRLRR